jgi:gamma-glutamyltranspeptidase / glutathione hydrolase
VYSDTYAYNADPDVVSVPVAKLTSKSYAASLCSKVNPMHAGPTVPPPYDQKSAEGVVACAQGDTIYLTTADRWGNMVSWMEAGPRWSTGRRRKAS